MGKVNLILVAPILMVSNLGVAMTTQPPGAVPAATEQTQDLAPQSPEREKASKNQPKKQEERQAKPDNGGKENAD